MHNIIISVKFSDTLSNANVAFLGTYSKHWRYYFQFIIVAFATPANGESVPEFNNDDLDQNLNNAFEGPGESES